MPETASITPNLAGQVWIKSLRYPFLNRAVYRILDRGDDIRRASGGAVFEVAGRSVPVAVADVRRSRQFTLYVQVATDEAARVMDLILTTGDTFLIHIPPDACTPGGYVQIDTTAQTRGSTAERWVFALPCTQVAPPGPDVVGTTLTWATVADLYGSWTALWAAHPDWASLYDTVGSPDDLVVV